MGPGTAAADDQHMAARPAGVRRLGRQGGKHGGRAEITPLGIGRAEPRHQLAPLAMPKVANTADEGCRGSHGHRLRQG